MDKEKVYAAMATDFTMTDIDRLGNELTVARNALAAEREQLHAAYAILEQRVTELERVSRMTWIQRFVFNRFYGKLVKASQQ